MSIWGRLDANSSLDANLSDFSKRHGQNALSSILVNIGKSQELLRNLRALNAEDMLSQDRLAAINNFKNQFSSLLNRLNKYDPNDPVSSLGSDPPAFARDVAGFYESLYASLHSDLAFLTSLKVGDPTTFLDGIQAQADKARADLEALQKQLKDSAEKQGEQIQGRVEKKGEQAVTDIIGAGATQDSADEYKIYIYQDGEPQRKITRVKKKRVDINKRRKGFWGSIRKFVTYVRLESYCLWLKLVGSGALYSGHSYANLVRKWRFWRGFYFLLLLSLAVLYLVFVLASGLPGPDEWYKFILEKLAFVPSIVVLSIGFAFSNRNYRINANLLEQYKHRYVVSKVVQRLLQLPEIKQDASLARRLLMVVAPILFEQRNTGYMGKSRLDDDLLRDLIAQVASQPKKD